MIKAVIFDAYGTLVEIRDRRRPYHALLRMLPGDTQIHRLVPLTAPTSIRSFARVIGAELSAERTAALEASLAAETASIRAFADVAPVWEALRARAIRIGICSNLATPYIDPVLNQLPFPPDAACWSCACGHMKDDPAVYAHICAQLDVHPGQALMVGDTYAADVAGPRAAGMRAVHLQRGTGSVSTEDVIGDLYGLLPMVDRPNILHSQR